MVTTPVYSYANINLGSARAYFVDADTGEELYAAIYMGNGEAGIWKGKRYMDTTFSIDCVDARTRIGGKVTADFWPGRRVLVKVWRPSHADSVSATLDGKLLPCTDRIEYKALITREKGWVGNENQTACRGAVQALMGTEARFNAAVARRSV